MINKGREETNRDINAGNAGEVYRTEEPHTPRVLFWVCTQYDSSKSRRLACAPLRPPIMTTTLGQLKTTGCTCVLADATETFLRLCLDSKLLEKAIIPQSRPPQPTISGTDESHAAGLDRRKPGRTEIRVLFITLLFCSASRVWVLRGLMHVLGVSEAARLLQDCLFRRTRSIMLMPPANRVTML